MRCIEGIEETTLITHTGARKLCVEAPSGVEPLSSIMSVTVNHNAPIYFTGSYDSYDLYRKSRSMKPIRITFEDSTGTDTHPACLIRHDPC